MDNKIETRYCFPEVFQAGAGDNYIVYAFMNDGSVRKTDIKPFIEKGGVFEPLKDKKLFKSALTVIGYTIAWDIEGNRDEQNCIDIDPFYAFESPVVTDIPEIG